MSRRRRTQDRSIREIRRAWEQTRSQEAAAAYLGALLRSGDKAANRAVQGLDSLWDNHWDKAPPQLADLIWLVATGNLPTDPGEGPGRKGPFSVVGATTASYFGPFGPYSAERFTAYFAYLGLDAVGAVWGDYEYKPLVHLAERDQGYQPIWSTGIGRIERVARHEAYAGTGVEFAVPQEIAILWATAHGAAGRIRGNPPSKRGDQAYRELERVAKQRNTVEDWLRLHEERQRILGPGRGQWTDEDPWPAIEQSPVARRLGIKSDDFDMTDVISRLVWNDGDDRVCLELVSEPDVYIQALPGGFSVTNFCGTEGGGWPEVDGYWVNFDVIYRRGPRGSGKPIHGWRVHEVEIDYDPGPTPSEQAEIDAYVLSVVDDAVRSFFETPAAARLIQLVGILEQDLRVGSAMDLYERGQEELRGYQARLAGETMHEVAMEQWPNFVPEKLILKNPADPRLNEAYRRWQQEGTDAAWRAWQQELMRAGQRTYWHDCPACRFLGTVPVEFQTSGGRTRRHPYDFYHCAGAAGPGFRGSILGRHSNEAGGYWSMPVEILDRNVYRSSDPRTAVANAAVEVALRGGILE